MWLAMENHFFTSVYLVQSQIPSLWVQFFSSKNGSAIYDRHRNIQGLEAKTRKALPKRDPHIFKITTVFEYQKNLTLKI